MCTVAGAESIVNVSVSQAGQLFAEGVDILGFFLAETGVLEQNNIAVAHGGNSSLGLVANNVVVISKGNRLAQLFAQANSNGSQAELGFGAVLRLAQMAAQDNLCAVSDQLFDGRRAALMRLSLMITPSFIGTLKSQRTSTRLPA